MTDLIRILDGNVFVLSHNNGDIEANFAVPSGFYSFDTRFLSRWQLSVNGEPLHALSIDNAQYFDATFFLVPGLPAQYVDAKASVIRERSIALSFVEELTVLNHDGEPAEFTIRLEADSDFAPVSTLKESTERVGQIYRRVEDRCLRLGYRREKFWRETVISTSEPAEIDEHGLTYRIRIEPHGHWTTTLHVSGQVLRPDGEDVRNHVHRRRGRTKKELQSDLDEWLAKAPTLMCDWTAFTKTYQRSLTDLAALRFSPLTVPDMVMPAAGLPWFATITGRDSIFTSLQVLPFAPELAHTTLKMLGVDQGAMLDDFHDEEPGKILHEFRYGEEAAFEELPTAPYYGSADATPLYVILLDEYERWTGDVALVRKMEEEARAALRWIDEYADIRGDGYVWYQRRNEQTGLENQCWKDSGNAISYHDGRLPGPLRATCELQGYAYDAKMRGARLAREFWNDPAYADQLEQQAADLKARFNRDFWVEDGEFYALALDSNGNQVDSLSSNIGHLLWSGIVDDSRAPKIVEHLLGPRLFSGWGVRTLATGEARYNPLGYHVGTVWPFDNSFIAWGLRRYGFVKEAGTIAQGIIDAAEYFDGRLPEAFGGYHRELTRHPIEYPGAASPRATSTGAPFLLLRAVLGLDPYEEDLVLEPEVPARFGRTELLDIPGRWGRVDAIGSL